MEEGDSGFFGIRVLVLVLAALLRTLGVWSCPSFACEVFKSLADSVATSLH